MECLKVSIVDGWLIDWLIDPLIDSVDNKNTTYHNIS
jgi:hypothetical protein